MQGAEKFPNRLAQRPARPGGNRRLALTSCGPDRRNEAQEGDRTENQVDGRAPSDERGDSQAGADSKLSHRGQEAACFADLLRRDDVGDDARVRRARGVEEELNDRVTDQNHWKVRGEHEDHETGNREERARDHDRPAPSKATVYAVGPRADQGRHRHGQEAANPERNTDAGVLEVSLGDDFVDLGLEQDGRQRDPEEVAPEPEGAERGMAQVAKVRLRHGWRRRWNRRDHGARLLLIGFSGRPDLL